VNNALSVVVNGRTRRRPEQVEAVLAAYETSGLTQRQFAERAGVGYSTLTYWLRRRRPGAPAVRSSGWVPVEVNREARCCSTYQVDCADGTRVRIPSGFDPTEVRRLLDLIGVCSR
jgi:hypothetical protein